MRIKEWNSLFLSSELQEGSLPQPKDAQYGGMLCWSSPFEWLLKAGDVIWAVFRSRTFQDLLSGEFCTWVIRKQIFGARWLVAEKKCWYKWGKRAIILKFAFSPVANSPNYKLMTVCLVQEMGQWKVSYRHEEKLALTLDKEKQAKKKKKRVPPANCQ